MKAISIVLIALFLIGSLSSVAEARGRGCSTVPYNDDRSEPLGVGVDIEYDINDMRGASIEVRNDFENDELAAYLVGKLKLNALMGDSD